MSCPNCDAKRINGLICHEHGCPTPYIGKTLECANCGTKFKPEEGERPLADKTSRGTIYTCSETCRNDYFGLSVNDDELCQTEEIA